MKSLDFGRYAFNIGVATAMLAGCGGGSQPSTGAGAIPRFAQIANGSVRLASGAAVNGWAPSDFQARYKLPISRGSNQIVAIVSAYDQPDAASDLSTYRTHFGLGPATFFKYNQAGYQGNLPAELPCGLQAVRGLLVPVGRHWH